MGRDPPVTNEFVPGQEDVAETFGESDVTVTHLKTETASEQIQLGTSSAATSYSTGNQYSNRTEAGYVINPNNDLKELVIDSLSGVSGAEEVRVEEVSTGTIVESTTDVSAPISITGSFSSGTDYAVYLYDSGGNLSYNINGDSFPLTNSEFDTTDEWEDGSTGIGGGISKMTGYSDNLSGQAYIEWPYPADVYEWGGAYFDAVLDGETVDVYAEEYDGSSWNEIAGPLSSGDGLPADPSRNVRFRVELSRASTSNNPRLKEIARREVFKVA
jgi:hypothetical protein